MVVISAPSTSSTGVEQERAGCPSTCTVQAPHKPAPQPNLVPFRPSSSRSTHNKGVSGSTSRVYCSPFTVRLSAIFRSSRIVIASSGNRYLTTSLPSLSTHTFRSPVFILPLVSHTSLFSVALSTSPLSFHISLSLQPCIVSSSSLHTSFKSRLYMSVTSLIDGIIICLCTGFLRLW